MGNVQVLKRKVPYPGKPLSPRETRTVGHLKNKGVSPGVQGD